ncbi:MAG: hypothetical protein ABI459_03655, partial [Deltaproteobacteria bacterium]
MAGTSKILTVSYGAFSCTLEGFDDPIAKMREVAEYYRDLAARDRNFGALPVSQDTTALKTLEATRTTHRISATPVDNSGATDSEAAAKLERIKAAETVPDTPIESAFDMVASPPETPEVVAPVAAASPVMPRRVEMPAAPETAEDAMPSEPEAHFDDATVDVDVSESAQAEPEIDNTESVRTAIRGLEADVVAAEQAEQVAADTVIDAESVDMPAAAPVAEVNQPRSSLLARLKGRFTGEPRPRAETYEEPIEPESRDPIVEKADEPVAEIDPVEAALAEVVAQEQRADRIERRHASTEAAQSDSLDRILERTNTQLGDNDASRRRSTISQLKAAVQATRARGDDGVEDDKPLDRFREDLQQAVAPEKPAEPPVRRMAPLMLVSDQRVDGTPADAIAARRTSGNLALAEDA